jgi:hypothetical protein
MGHGVRLRDGVQEEMGAGIGAGLSSTWLLPRIQTPLSSPRTHTGESSGILPAASSLVDVDLVLSVRFASSLTAFGEPTTTELCRFTTVLELALIENDPLSEAHFTLEVLVCTSLCLPDQRSPRWLLARIARHPFWLPPGTLRNIMQGT